MNKQEFIDKTVEFEKQTLQESGEIIMKITAMDVRDQITIFALPNYNPKYKIQMLFQLGRFLKTKIPDLVNLILVSDTYFSKAKPEELPPKEKEVMQAYYAGELRLQEIPSEFHHLRSEALCLLSRDWEDKLEVVLIPYKRNAGEIIFEKPETMSEKGSLQAGDNMLVHVWEGYRSD